MRFFALSAFAQYNMAGNFGMAGRDDVGKKTPNRKNDPLLQTIVILLLALILPGMALRIFSGVFELLAAYF